MDNPIKISGYKSLKDNKQLREQAAKMYYSGEFYPTEIADRLCIDINELGYYVFGKDKTGTSERCWKYKKDNGNIPQFVQTYEAIKPLYIKKTEKKLLDLANSIVDKISGDEDKILDMDAKDLSNIVNALEKIDRIGRLEEGKATQNVVQERTTFTLRDILNAKPKSDIQDVEFKEIKSEKN